MAGVKNRSQTCRQSEGFQARARFHREQSGVPEAREKSFPQQILAGLISMRAEMSDQHCDEIVAEDMASDAASTCVPVTVTKSTSALRSDGFRVRALVF